MRTLSDAEFNRSLDVNATWPAEMLPQTFQGTHTLESEAAGLAAMHHTDEDMQRLDYCVQGFTGIYHSKPEDWNVQGSALNDLFHKLIIEASLQRCAAAHSRRPFAHHQTGHFMPALGWTP